MLRVLLAAAILGLAGAQDMPVARPSGSAQGPAGPPSVQTASPPQLPPLAVSQIDPRDITLDSPRRLTLSFAEPRPIDEVLALLTAGTGFSVALDRDATGSFRGELKQLTLRESLTALLEPLGLDHEVSGTVIRVRRRQLHTRLFELDLLNVQRGLERTSGGADATVTTSVAQDDVVGGVADGVKALLSENGTVHVDKRAGLLQVTDFSDRLDRVAIYVETLHQRTGRQVQLRLQAFEVTLREGSSIDWTALRQRLGLRTDSPDSAVAANPSALFKALGAQGDVRSLWAPDISALNNEPALMRLATDGGRALTMTVVPQISADGMIRMSVSHAWEEPAGERKDGWLKSTPIARVSEADTVMRVMDGQTAIIAGLTRPQQVAVAPTGKLSSVFGSSSKREGHAELVVLVRPVVIGAGTFVGGYRN